MQRRIMLTSTLEYFVFLSFTVACINLRNSCAIELKDIKLLHEALLIHNSIPEKARLNFTETAIKYGYNCEEYEVTTRDGYILKLFHIVGDKTKPVLLMHGLADSSDSFIIRGNTSLAIALSKAGYDVWAGNCRGNKYSRRHVLFDPDVDDEFWNFSFHEIGINDLSTLIDFVLDKIKERKLNTIGHSQGATIHFVLGVIKPEYNDKINVFIALASVCFMRNVELEKIINLPKPLITFNNGLTEEFNRKEIFKGNSTLKYLLSVVCTHKGIGYDICAKGVFFPLFGNDPEGIDKDFFYTYIRKFPTSTSIKSFIHYVQLSKSGKFSQFDYGLSNNLKLYRSFSSPEYDLDNVTMKTALIVSKNDKLSTIPDVNLLDSKLSNIVKYHVMSRDKFNHLDFTVGRFMEDELFPQLFDILETNS